MAAAVRNARLQQERRRLEAAEAAALRGRRRARAGGTVLDAVGDGIFLVDAEGVVRFWNRAAELITGLAADRPATGRPQTVRRLGGARRADSRCRARQVGTLDDPSGLRRGVISGSRSSPCRCRSGIVYAFRDLTSERGSRRRRADLIATISHELRTPMAAVYGAAKTLLRATSSSSTRRARSSWR